MNTEFLVACLCAQWCSSCREYRPKFDLLRDAYRHSIEISFRWIDIEDQADRVGDIEVENFPTFLIQRGQLVLFFGPLLPETQILARLIDSFLVQTPEEALAYAIATAERREWQQTYRFLVPLYKP